MCYNHTISAVHLYYIPVSTSSAGPVLQGIGLRQSLWHYEENGVDCIEAVIERNTSGEKTWFAITHIVFSLEVQASRCFWQN